MRSREGAEAEERGGHGNLQAFGQGANLVHGIGFHNPVAGEDDGALGREDKLEGFGESGVLGRKHGVRAVRRGHGGGKIEIGQALLRILGDVYQHRTRASGTGNEEGFAKHRGDILRVG